MLRDVLTNRLVLGALLGVVLIVVGSTLYLLHVERENRSAEERTAELAQQYNEQNRKTARETEAGPPTQAGHFHADGTYHAEPHQAPQPPAERNTPQGHFHPDGTYHAEPHAAEETSKHPIRVPDTTAKTPPDDYHGDPLYWIEGMQYETLITSNGGYISTPVIPPEKLNRIDDVYDLPYREETKHLTREQLHQLEVEILVEGLSPLDAAKFLVAYGFYEKYAGEYAQQALDENPNDFNTLYVWTKLQPEEATRIQGFRRLVQMNPTSASALRSLGMYLGTGDDANRTTIREAIPYLKRAAALDPNAYQGEAFYLLSMAYLRLGDADKALEYLNRAQAIHDSMRRRELIELIEKGELP